MNSLSDKVFAVYGSKIASLYFDKEAIHISSQKFMSVEGFKEAWNRKLSLANKVQIKYGFIKHVSKEDGDDEIAINYKNKLGYYSDFVFKLSDTADLDVFYEYFIKERYFQKSYQKLEPFKANFSYFIGLICVIAASYYCYFEAIDLANGVVEYQGSSSKVRAFNFLLNLIGDKGVLLVGSLLGAFFIQKIWTRFRNPPYETKLISPNR